MCQETFGPCASAQAPESSGAAAVALAPRKVLHVGCGAQVANKLHAIFRRGDWSETRLDINEGVRPDIVCSIIKMKSAVKSAAYDALWSSHNIEHLHSHEVAPAFAEFFRVLKPDGFALTRCPDLEAVAETLLRQGPDRTVYISPAGPITALDMIYGHGTSVANGNVFMRHHTGFTAERIGKLLLDAGFGEIHTKKSPDYDLWAVAFMPEARPAEILRELADCDLTFGQ